MATYTWLPYPSNGEVERRVRSTQIFVTEARDHVDAQDRVRDQLVPQRRGVVWETLEAQSIDLTRGVPVEVFGGTVGSWVR